MTRVKIGPVLPDRKTIGVEVARLRDLDVGDLRRRWDAVFGRRPHPNLPRHLLFRVLAYRLQADHLGDLDGESQRLLDRSVSPEDAGQRALALAQRTADLRPGTVLEREWNGHVQRVAVLADGFAWNGKTYPSLSKVAVAITGTRWSGPRFFGLRDKIDRLVADLNRSRTELRPGTLFTREWDSHLQQVMVLADGFAWNGKTYRSLSQVAFAMTGSRWNGPRFFGLRDRPSSEARP